MDKNRNIGLLRTGLGLLIVGIVWLGFTVAYNEPSKPSSYILLTFAPPLLILVSGIRFLISGSRRG